jgi:hypothetical protein
MGLFEEMAASGKGKTEPPAEMRAAAQSMWQIYVSLRDAGFSRADALELVRTMLVSAINSDDESKKEGQ